MITQDELRALQRIAQGIERLRPEAPENEVKSADAYVWHADLKLLIPVRDPNYIDLSLLLGIDEVRDTLVANTMQFAKGFSANNALLWGARGMGKSSLVKAVYQHVNKQLPHSLVLVEIHRQDIATLPQLMEVLRGWVVRRFIVFCDDLSFDSKDSGYKSLKSALEGGIENRTDHVLFYATSNRRHLMPREIAENERSTAVQPAEGIEEEVSLSDRFGLWLGFHSCSLITYLSIVEAYADRFKLDLPREDLRQQAFLWASARGARSGRVAWQFIQDLAGKMGRRIS